MAKALILLAVLFLLVCSITIICYASYNDIKTNSQEYQGPVPLGYDEEYFRETGITKLIGENR